MKTEESSRISAAFAALALGALALAAAPARAQSGDHLETIHHPNYDKSVFMPFAPAIKIKSGRILWLAGGTALPVYHDHPHKREQILKYLTNDLEAQTRQAMDGIMQTLKAAGASPKDVVHVFIFRARPRKGEALRDCARASRDSRDRARDSRAGRGLRRERPRAASREARRSSRRRVRDRRAAIALGHDRARIHLARRQGLRGGLARPGAARLAADPGRCHLSALHEPRAFSAGFAQPPQPPAAGPGD